MIKDLTKDEIVWRIDNLLEFVSDQEHLIKVQPEDKSIFPIDGLIKGALIYLEKVGAIRIILHNEDGVYGAVFTASREECENTSWIEPDKDESHYGDRPSEKEIPVPVLFNERGNENFTSISLVIDFPDTNIGKLCKKMIGYLRNICNEDINVINAAVFLHYCVSEEYYSHCLLQVLPYALLDDVWSSSMQLPLEVIDIIERVMKGPALNVYDPFMRTGINMCYANGDYHAQATDKYHMYSTMLWAGVAGVDTENIEYEDCLTNWDARNSDFIIATPEFGKEVVNSLGETESINSVALEKVFKSMDAEGRSALLLLTASSLTSTGKMEKLRHDITESNLLDTVVLLPANIFNKTSVATAIIYLKSGREDGSPITFMDFSYFIKDLFAEEKNTVDLDRIKKAVDEHDKMYIREVSVSDVRKREYEWYSPNYMEYAESVPAGYREVYLSEILETFECEDSISYSGNIIREEYLVEDPFEQYNEDPESGKIDLSSLSKQTENDEVEDDYDDKYMTCKGNPFVVQFGENELKTYYHEFNPVIFSDVSFPKSCHAYRIDTALIDINYLRLLLAQVDKESNGKLRRHGIKRWNDDSGIDPILQIPLSLEEQRRIYENAKLNAAVEKARKDGLDKAIDSMKQEYMMEVRMRKHDMKPFLSQLDSQAKLLSYYLEKIEGNEDIVNAMRQKLTGISNAVSELRLHLNRLTEEDVFGKPEVVNPLDILNELTGTFANYSVALEVDTVALKEAQIDTPEIFISKVDFSTLATTIIENAVSHAFTEDEKDYKVLINLSYSAKKDLFIIDFKNNGNPMPQGMDKFRYGLKGEKGAKSNGSGLGGYRVKAITRHYSGDYDVFINRMQNTTTIRVMFPKYNSHE